MMFSFQPDKLTSSIHSTDAPGQAMDIVVEAISINIEGSRAIGNEGKGFGSGNGY